MIAEKPWQRKTPTKLLVMRSLSHGCWYRSSAIVLDDLLGPKVKTDSSPAEPSEEICDIY